LLKKLLNKLTDKTAYAVFFLFFYEYFCYTYNKYKGDVITDLNTKDALTKKEAINITSKAIKDGLFKNKYCKYCGDLIDEDSIFCKKCGKKQ